MSKHRILLIDDDIDICAVLKTALSPNYEIVTANDGYSGLQKIQACEPDMVILDVKMPKLDGHQLCDAIKHSKNNKSIPIVFITGHGSLEDELNAFQQGADLYIYKPFDITELVGGVDKLLSKSTPRVKTLSLMDIENMG